MAVPASAKMVDAIPRPGIPDPVIGWAVLRYLIRVLAALALDHGTHFDVLLRCNPASSRMFTSVGVEVENRVESGTNR